MNRILVVGLLLSLILSACSAYGPQSEDISGEEGLVVIYAEDG
jgi:hypothetical protein